MKPDGNKSLFRQFNKRDSRGEVTCIEKKNAEGNHKYRFSNNLALNDTHTKIRVNMLVYEFTDKKGKIKTFSWITNIEMTKANVHKIEEIGRTRWKIENETFNTLKNQGYHFEHNYGHGEENLCTNFAYLMMLAFCIDQIQQSSCNYFKVIHTYLETRKKLWEVLRSVFKILPRKNMTELFIEITKMYQIRLE